MKWLRGISAVLAIILIIMMAVKMHYISMQNRMQKYQIKELVRQHDSERDQIMARISQQDRKIQELMAATEGKIADRHE